MTYLDTLTADIRRQLDGAGHKGLQIVGILDALGPALRDNARGHAALLADRNRIARELADLRDEKDERTRQAVISAFRTAHLDWYIRSTEWTDAGELATAARFDFSATEAANRALAIENGEVNL